MKASSIYFLYQWGKAEASYVEVVICIALGCNNETSSSSKCGALYGVCYKTPPSINSDRVFA